MSQPRFAILVFSLVIIIFCAYAGLFIYRTSYVIHENSYIPKTQRYFALIDDEMISMRYARNLARGDGLTWNPNGERVEGFTNPLWVGLMALVHLVESDQTRTSLWVQMLSAVFLVVNLVMVRKLALLVTGRDGAALGAVVFTAFYFPLNFWSLQGAEVGLLALINTTAVVWTVSAMLADRFTPGPYILLGVGTLVRLDMTISLLALVSFLVVADHRRWKWHVLAAMAVLVAFLGSQTLLRHWYYGDWLPNTYYLKMTGYPVAKRIENGLWVFSRYVFVYGVSATLAAGIIGLRWRSYWGLLAWFVVIHSAYTVWIGGDTWDMGGTPNRFLSQVAPLMFVLLWGTLVEVRTWIGQSSIQRRQNLLVHAGFAVLVVMLFVNFNYNLVMGGKTSVRQWILLDRSYMTEQNAYTIRRALFVNFTTTGDARIAVVAAGTVPYFADRTYIDMLGKSDRVIARTQVNPLVNGLYHPGHMKWDYRYSLLQLAPDVVLDNWWMEDVSPYLGDAYTTVTIPNLFGDIYVLKDSPNIFWDRLP